MGAGFSSLGNSDAPPSKPGLGDLPESCLALVLSFLDPLEICRLACLSTTFRRASLADIVWESKLPENYQILAEKAFFFTGDDDNDAQTSKSDIITTTSKSKKEIFDRLCCPNRFDCNTKEFWMEKNGGQTCVAISWKGLKITGIADRRYWNHISTDESRFQSIAYLRQIWWLEVEGNLDFEFPAGNYSLFFRLQLGRTSRRLGNRRVCNPEQVHGWDLKPVQFKLLLQNGQHATSQYYLNKVAAGKWMEYYVGDFVVEDSYTRTNLKFSMTQIDCTHSKGGLCLDSVLIYPSS